MRPRFGRAGVVTHPESPSNSLFLQLPFLCPAATPVRSLISGLVDSCQLLGSMSLLGPQFSTPSRSHPPHHGLRVFDAARPDRDSFRRLRSEWASTDRTCSCGQSGPAECSAAHPYPMQDNSKLACHRHGSFLLPSTAATIIVVFDSKMRVADGTGTAGDHHSLRLRQKSVIKLTENENGRAWDDGRTCSGIKAEQRALEDLLAAVVPDRD